jgi:hypothetical protein
MADQFSLSDEEKKLMMNDFQIQTMSVQLSIVVFFSPIILTIAFISLWSASELNKEKA